MGKLHHPGKRSNYQKTLGKIREGKRLKVSEVDALFLYWQTQLRLQDWVIAWRYSRARDMGNEERSAENTIHYTLKECDVAFRDPVDFVNPREVDFEVLLVHELLHLYFRYWNWNHESRAEYMLDEQAIQCLATSFVGLRRQMERKRELLQRVKELRKGASEPVLGAPEG